MNDDCDWLEDQGKQGDFCHFEAVFGIIEWTVRTGEPSLIDAFSQAVPSWNERTCNWFRRPSTMTVMTRDA